MATPPPNPNASFASASLYVGDLATDVTEALLFEIFNAVGPVASVRVCRDAATRRSLGYAYVNYHRLEDAERALDTMNFKPVRNKPCRIMWSHRDPSLRKSGKGNIFVKNLSPSIDNKSLYDTFSMFGNILSCKVSTNKAGESLGYGFVHYEGEEAATMAIERVNGKVIAGEKVLVLAFQSRQERGVEDTATEFTNVYVKNIPEEYDDAKLKELFDAFGDVQSCKIALDEKGVNRGFGFINFNDPEHAAKAVEGLNDKEMGGEKKLYVGRAQKKTERDQELRERFENLKLERQKKYAGVNLYVKNLADSTDEAKIREEFGKHGTITSARVMVDQQGKTKGFGFVCFATPEEANKGVQEMNGRLVDGKPLYVALAQRKDQRRVQLDQQYGQRKGGPQGMQPQMYGQPGMQPMYFPAGMPQRNVFYPGQQQQMMRQWQPGQQGAPMQGGPQVNYQLMAVQPRAGGRGGRGGRGRKGSENNVRNQRSPQGMQQQQMQQQQMQRQQQPAEAAAAPAAEPQSLTIKELAAAPDEQRKQMIGERLFPLVKAYKPKYAGKITGMLLEMDNSELLHLLESQQALNEKVNEADMVLQEFAAAQQP